MVRGTGYDIDHLEFQVTGDGGEDGEGGSSAGGGDLKCHGTTRFKEEMARRPKLQQVRKTPSWHRSWANFSRLWMHSHRDAWANWHRLGQLDTFLAPGTRQIEPAYL
jgi:hypothetical protein